VETLNILKLFIVFETGSSGGGAKGFGEPLLPSFSGAWRSLALVPFYVIDVKAMAATAFAAENARRRQKQKRRRHKQQHSKARKDADDLRPMPYHGSPRVTQLILARSAVVMAQQEVVIERLQTIPAKDVLASLAHHLRAPFFPFDQNVTNGAPLDGRRIEGTVRAGCFHRRRTATQKILKEIATAAAAASATRVALRSNFALGSLRARFPTTTTTEIHRRRGGREEKRVMTLAVRMPLTFTNGAEDEAASGTRDRLRRNAFALGAGSRIFDATHVTNGLAPDGRAPSAVGVVLDLPQGPEPDVIGVSDVVVEDLPDLIRIDLPEIRRTLAVRTRNF